MREKCHRYTNFFIFFLHFVILEFSKFLTFDDNCKTFINIIRSVELALINSRIIFCNVVDFNGFLKIPTVRHIYKFTSTSIYTFAPCWNIKTLTKKEMFVLQIRFTVLYWIVFYSPKKMQKSSKLFPFKTITTGGDVYCSIRVIVKFCFFDTLETLKLNRGPNLYSFKTKFSAAHVK